MTTKTTQKITSSMQAAIDYARASKSGVVRAGKWGTKSGRPVNIKATVLQALVRRGIAEQVIVEMGVYAVRLIDNS